ncbi:MAG: D-glycero-beta-D-manno-heptose 1-phosphate adenylyltransferase [Candidatus Coatesbacteria bacterium]
MSRIVRRGGAVPLERLLPSLKAARARGRRIVFTNGVFDLLHVGHARYLAAARATGDLLVVGLNSDASVRRIKGPKRPIVPEAERAEMLMSLRSVDHVVVFGDDTPERLIRAIRPDVLVKGADWAPGKIVGADAVKAAGGRVVRVRLARGRSTTALVGRIASRYTR